MIRINTYANVPLGIVYLCQSGLNLHVLPPVSILHGVSITWYADALSCESVHVMANAWKSNAHYYTWLTWSGGRVRSIIIAA